MKKLRWIMMVLLASFPVQGAMSMELRAQEESTNSDNEKAMLLTSTDVNSMGQANGQVLLSDLLSTLERHFDVTFLYKDEVVMNKYVNPIKIGEETGQELSWILDRLGLAFQQIDEQTYVLLRKKWSPQTTPAQEEISGTVTDAQSGETLPGVNVIVKGTTTGTSTGSDGSFEFTVESLQDTLVFSFVGYQTQEVPINGDAEINVALQSEAIAGEELVVVGYGTQEQETLTGSISRISGEEVTKSPSPNLTTSLAGKLPGLVVNQRTGVPGTEDIDMLIRGSGTFGNNNPLIVIDGVPRSNMSRLNPSDIESMTVLKDASAAIYGARAANGVILITTKQGSEGSPTFSLSYNSAFHEPTKLPDMMDAALFSEAYNEAEWYRQGRPDRDNFTPFYTTEAIQKYRNGSDPVLYPNTDWVDATTKNYSYQQRANLQMSGGSEKVRYLLSLGMIGQDSNFKNNPTEYSQYNARARVNVDLTEDLTVGANINTDLNYRTYEAGGSFALDSDAGGGFAIGEGWVGILQSNPTLAAEYPNGLIAPGRFRGNPLLADRMGYSKIEDFPLFTSFTASYDVPFVEGLALDASFNYDLRNEFHKDFAKPYFYHEYNANTQEYDRLQAGETIELTDKYRKWTNSLFNFRISYETTVSQYHNISAMVGTEQQKETFSYAMAYRKGFVSSAIPQIDAGSTDPEDISNAGSASESAYNNYFGRLNYDYSAKYLLEFVFRYDGSQIFPDGNRYGFFPAVSAGWRLSEEDFISDNLPFVSELKLRGSYGELGNDRVGAYQYLQSFSYTNQDIVGHGEGADAVRGTDQLVLGWGRMLEGRNPLDVHRLFYEIRRGGVFGGGQSGMYLAALAAVETALWDLAGKALEVPVYQMLGGKFRDRVRVYMDTALYQSSQPAPEDFAKSAQTAVDYGMTAVKFDLDQANDPNRYDQHNWTANQAEIDRMYDQMAAAREQVGPNVDICADMHGRYDLPTGKRVAQRLEPLNLMWLEEPIPAENAEAYKLINESTSTPICAGENHYLAHDFRELFEIGAVDMVMPDLQKCGGLGEGQRIANLAQLYYIPFAPHMVSSYLGAMACAHVCASVPNFMIMEWQIYFHEDEMFQEIVDFDSPMVDNEGYVPLSEKPGIGVEINEEAMRKYATEGYPFFD